MNGKISSCLFGFILLCFFLPWFNVSCMNERVMTLSGSQLAGITEIKEPSFAGRAKARHESEPLAVLIFFFVFVGLIPFFYSAYSRSCELTADRIGAYLCGSRETANRALAMLACGSYTLSPRTNIAALKDQERQLNKFFAFIGDLFSTHPRITKRLMEIENAAHLFKA